MIITITGRVSQPPRPPKSGKGVMVPVAVAGYHDGTKTVWYADCLVYGHQEKYALTLSVGDMVSVPCRITIQTHPDRSVTISPPICVGQIVAARKG